MNVRTCFSVSSLLTVVNQTREHCLNLSKMLRLTYPRTCYAHQAGKTMNPALKRMNDAPSPSNVGPSNWRRFPDLRQLGILRRARPKYALQVPVSGSTIEQSFQPHRAPVESVIVDQLPEKLPSNLISDATHDVKDGPVRLDSEKQCSFRANCRDRAAGLNQRQRPMAGACPFQ